MYSLLFLNGQEEFELWRELFFTVEPVGEVDSSDAAVSMDSHS